MIRALLLFLLSSSLGLASPLSGVAVSASLIPIGLQEAAGDTAFQWKSDLDLALRESAISGKPIFVRFEAAWSATCASLANEFEKPAFGAINDAAVLLRINFDQNPELVDDYDITSVPTVLLLDANGEIVALKEGGGKVDEWVDWMKEAVKETEFEMPDVLASNDPPTRTEIKDLIEHLGSRDPTMRQLTMERLAAFPGKTRKPLIESLQQPGKLSQKLSVLEILDRWHAPINGLDPWIETTFSAEQLEEINAWNETPLEELETVLMELTDADFESAKEEITQLLKSKNIRANLARLTRYGAKLLPIVYQRLEQSQSDDETSRLTALRYWLISSNELRLGWSGGILELASSSLDSRRSAATALISRASLLDEPLLLELFADPDPLVRELSLKGLQRIGAKQTDETMARLLNDPDKNVRAAVLKQFTDAEASHMASYVSKYLETETDTDLIVHALRFMKNATGDKSVASVLRFANHESWQVRAEVAAALGEIQADNLSLDTIVVKGEAVMKLLEDPDGFVVSRAVKSLPRKKDAKMLQTLTDIALRKPNIAKEIVDSMADNFSGYSRSGETSLEPFLLQFLDQDNAAVRVAGLNGYAKKYVEKLTDEQLVKFLKAKETNLRLEALDALFNRFEWIRKKSKRPGESATTGVYFEPNDLSMVDAIKDIVTSTEIVPELVESSRQLEQDEDVVEQEDEESDSNAADDSDATPEAQSSDEADESKTDEDKDEEPQLLQEEFIENWLKDDELRPKLDGAIAELSEAAQSTNDKERTLALVCQVILGDHSESLDELMDMSSTNAQLKYVTNTLPWLPFKLRTRTFQALLDKADSKEDFSSILQAYSSVQNPEAAQRIWELAGNSLASFEVLQGALLAAYFGNSVNSYTAIANQNIDKTLLEIAKEDIVEQNVEEHSRKQQLALILLQQLDLENAKLIVAPLAESAKDLETRDLALRILLLPVQSNTDGFSRSSSVDTEKNRSKAVQYLETDQPWQFKTVVRFLAHGEKSLQASVNPDNKTQLGNQSYYYSSSTNSSQGKIRIPKVPKGMTKEMLSPPDMQMDEETLALTTYFRALLEQNVDLEPLLSYYRTADKKPVSKLVYQAIAMQNDDNLIPVVSEIYKKTGGKADISFSADLYWTIRMMDGKQAIKLRKKIRDEIGMNDLTNY